MPTSSPTPPTIPARGQHGLSFLAVVLGCSGVVFYQIAPFGIILSGVGLCFGIAAWFTASARGGVGVGYAIASTLLCAVALAIDVLTYSVGLANFVRPS
jgi:hypothetical protein